MTIRALAQHVRGGILEPTAIPDLPPPGPDDVDVDVLHCSVCHSDVHLLDGDWGEPKRPLVPGHEIVGRKSDGTLVGIGWQAGSCGTCAACTSGREHLCGAGKIRTCVGRAGGFAERVRVDRRFCFDLPHGLDPAVAAPLFCAGLTVFSPLSRFPARRVGVVGFGGLGHLAVQFARGMGAEVLAFDRHMEKRDLARSLGASDLVDAGGALPEGAVDLLLVTTPAALDWSAWMKVLDLEGTLCLVGIPTSPLQLSPDPLLDEQKRVTGSVIGSPAVMRGMLAFAAEHRVAPIIERMPMGAANEAITRVREGKARMRIVLDA